MSIPAIALYKSLLRDLRPHMSVRQLWAFRKEGPNYFDRTRCGVRTVQSLMLAVSFFKKLVPQSTDKADSAALLAFLERDYECSVWKLVLENDQDHLLYGELKQLLYGFFHPGNGRSCLLGSDYDVFLKGRCGPGVSVGSSGQHLFNKLFSGKLTASRSVLYTLYKSYVKGFPDWDAAEMHRHCLFGEASIVEDSSLGFVPKERSKSRVICSEKSLDMFFQLGLGSVVEDRLRHYWGIDFRFQQDKNREIARLGSLCGFDGLKYCTVDLKNASDMPFSMAESVYPDHIMKYLKRYRSESTLIRGLGSRKLDILSSMGNGFTFPMQTTLFAAIILASYRYHGIKPEFPHGNKLGNFGVFGDDLVFRTECAETVYRLLKILGFTVNVTKSFSEGSFRESCGADFFKGVNVRGVYLKTLSSPQARYSAINSLVEWSARSGVLLCQTIRMLTKSVRYQPVPRWENPDAGIRMPYSLAVLATDRRAAMLRSRFQLDLVGYKAYRPVAEGWTIDGCGFKGPPHLIRELKYNPFGLWLCFLQGSLENGRGLVRSTRTRYRLQNLLTPCWDHVPNTWEPGKVSRESPYPLRMITWERWNTASYQNHGMT